MAFDKDSKEIAIGQIVTVTGGLLAGGALAFYTDKIALIPGIFVLLPGFLDMRGDVVGSLAARLSSELHIGSIDIAKQKRQGIRDGVVAAFLLSLAASVILGLVAYAASYFIFKINNPDIIWVAIIATIVSNLILIPLTVKSTVWFFAHGYDPDNVMGPYITVVGDVAAIVSLLIAIVIVT
ncbi:magnesium transporter [Candidatus Woesearchaeota archaeon]|nr:magnesium transporter [Candidatus Woesearchaeota archaeon]